MFEIIIVVLVVAAGILWVYKSRNQAQRQSAPPKPTPTPHKPKGTKTPRKQTPPPERPPETPIKTDNQLLNEYPSNYYGSFRLKPQKDVHSITAIDLKGSKVLYGDTKNELVMFDLKGWKKEENTVPHRYFVRLDNNTPTAVAIGTQYYYATLNFEKTIVYYSFTNGENGIYFKQVKKFERNILKSNAESIHVPSNEKYIVTTGEGADTVIDIWSMSGQRLAGINTYQIQHYKICYGASNILIRGWTSEAKIFKVSENKDGSFKTLEKHMHLKHDQCPLQTAIDNYDLYAVSITKQRAIRIWYLYQGLHDKYKERSFNDILPGVNKCAIHTIQPAHGHYKTLIILANQLSLLVLNCNLVIVKRIDGIDCKELYLSGTKQTIVLGTITKDNRIRFWNMGQEINGVKHLSL